MFSATSAPGELSLESLKHLYVIRWIYVFLTCSVILTAVDVYYFHV